MRTSWLPLRQWLRAQARRLVTAENVRRLAIRASQEMIDLYATLYPSKTERYLAVCRRAGYRVTPPPDRPRAGRPAAAAVVQAIAWLGLGIVIAVAVMAIGPLMIGPKRGTVFSLHELQPAAATSTISVIPVNPARSSEDSTHGR